MRRLLWVLAFVLAITSTVSAETVLLGSTPISPATWGTGVYRDQWLAMSFSLNNTSHVSAVNLYVFGAAECCFNLQLTNALGPGTTPANVLAEGTVSPGWSSAWQSVPMSVTLIGGTTYYLVVSTTNTGGGWVDATSLYGDGTAGGFVWTSPWWGQDSFAPASNWSYYTSSLLSFEIVGAPEPATLMLLGVGLLAIARKRRG